MTKTTAALYTGHSYRIGAATHLFKIHNATPDTLKLLEGWDSDAYKNPSPHYHHHCLPSTKLVP